MPPRKKRDARPSLNSSGAASDVPTATEGLEAPASASRTEISDDVLPSDISTDTRVASGEAPEKPAMITLATTYTGRLGYACLNTVLRNAKPPVFTSRTCRLATVAEKGIDFAKELALQNVHDLTPMLEWNEKHHIRFMRLSSEMFPFASHEKHGYPLDFAREPLRQVGALARRLGHRLTFHPGQFTLLSSSDPGIIRRSMADLQMHADIFNLMEMGPDSVTIIHGGGAYGDKEEALRRIERNILALPKDVRDRLVLENDEIVYSVEDLLPICERTEVPLVLDWHHASILPSEHPSEHYLDRILATWKKRGIKPKMHYSESRPGAKTPMERRAHSDRVKILPPHMPPGDLVDLMIEAKDKEQAVLDLYERYGIFPVSPEARVPPAPAETLETKGRKRKGKKAKEVEEVESEAVTGEVEIVPEASAIDDPCCSAGEAEVVVPKKRTRSAKKR
ncbi:UV-endonuclease UvdE-domain-containing protein [Hyaloraphidium curvatum]|nr:UV-endonuclease UvdE-domain-containing protein [Hyaloraphidium curvatum]